MQTRGTTLPSLPVTGRVFAVVSNHAAGALVGQADPTTAVEAAFAARGLTATFFPPEDGSLTYRLEKARDSGADVVVVMGGDGSVCCAAQMLCGTGVAVGILPSGTMNLMARDLGLPIGDLDAAVQVLADGVVRRIDVGEVNGRVFLCGSMLGLPTRLAKVREAGRGGPGLRLWSRFLRATLRILARSRRHRLDLVIDGIARRVRTPAMTVTVNRLTDGTGRQFGRGRLDGGTLALYVFNRLGLGDAMRIGLATLFGRWRGDAAVDELGGAEIKVASPRPALRVMNDGELMLLDTPLIYRIRPAALAVLAPAADRPDA